MFQKRDVRNMKCFKNLLLCPVTFECRIWFLLTKTPECANTIQVKTDQGALERVKEIK